MSFDVTADWTTYESKELNVKLPKGASYITFATVGGNDGPNLDQLELALVKADETTIVNKLTKPRFDANSTTRVRLFSLTGQLLREGASLETENLAPGMYLLQKDHGSIFRQQIIHVK